MPLLAQLAHEDVAPPLRVGHEKAFALEEGPCFGQCAGVLGKGGDRVVMRVCQHSSRLEFPPRLPVLVVDVVTNESAARRQLAATLRRSAHEKIEDAHRQFLDIHRVCLLRPRERAPHLHVFRVVAVARPPGQASTFLPAFATNAGTEVLAEDVGTAAPNSTHWELNDAQRQVFEQTRDCPRRGIGRIR